MANISNEVLSLSVDITYCSLLVAFVFSFVRLILGPTLADRVVALDFIAFITIGVIVVYTLDSGQTAFLDVAITLGLVSFLGTIAFARFIAKREDIGEE